MKKAAIALMVASTLGLGACQPQKADPMLVEELKLETEQQKQSYAFGANVGSYVGKRITDQTEVGVELDNELVLKGFIAAIQGKSQLGDEEIQEINLALDNAFKEGLQKKEAMVGEENIVKGETFLAENAEREEVTVTDSGLQYEVLTASDGPKPEAQDTVQVHYRGTLLDGTEFDSSYSRGEPATFPLHRVIAGWTEGVQLMSVGSKYKFFIPSALAYGARSTGAITPNSTLIFEVELLDIIGEPSAN